MAENRQQAILAVAERHEEVARAARKLAAAATAEAKAREQLAAALGRQAELEGQPGE